MSLSWQAAVKLALNRYAIRHKTIQIQRLKFLEEELEQIMNDTLKRGQTPKQTVSRILQELRDEGFLFFSNNNGKYILNHVTVNVLNEDLPDDVLDNAIDNGNLILDEVKTSNIIQSVRVRRGMGALRRLTLGNYRHECALCDISDGRLLVTSHIARWADKPSARGLLTNTICFCTLHDKLFENGYFYINEHNDLEWQNIKSVRAIENWKIYCTDDFKLPLHHLPSPIFLAEHRDRIYLES
jgi:predicted restriction endonuclease